MAQILLAHETLGTLWSPKYEETNNKRAERPGERLTAVNGTAIHQLAASDEGSREIYGVFSVSRTNKSILNNFFEDATNFIITLQDGEEAYRGYLKNLALARSVSPTHNKYAFTFYVLEKLS